MKGTAAEGKQAVADTAKGAAAASTAWAAITEWVASAIEPAIEEASVRHCLPVSDVQSAFAALVATARSTAANAPAGPVGRAVALSRL